MPSDMENLSPMACGIALGSNLGDRLENLTRGVILLLERLPAAKLLAVAPLYETAAVDCEPGTASFYNSFIEVECLYPPLKLRKLTAGIEEFLGRPKLRGHHEPRTLDLDLLYCGDQVLNTDELTLPHPRIAQRRFVLEPVAAVCPDLILPGQSQTIAQLLAALSLTEPEPLTRIHASGWLDLERESI